MTDSIRLALDKASVRTIDANGFMRVKISPFTKEQVAPYYGREIPGWEQLGLNPGKIYYGYRPASELSDPAAVNSINGIPVHLRHHADFAEAPAHGTRVGAAGTDAEWRAPYLMNSLTIYDKEAQDGINSNEIRDLSLAYQYQPDMKTGEWQGQHYDFIMRHIRGNHVALVEEGRAGHDVLVFDSKQNINQGDPIMGDTINKGAEQDQVSTGLEELEKRGGAVEAAEATDEQLDDLEDRIATLSAEEQTTLVALLRKLQGAPAATDADPEEEDEPQADDAPVATDEDEADDFAAEDEPVATDEDETESEEVAEADDVVTDEGETEEEDDQTDIAADRCAADGIDGELSDRDRKIFAAGVKYGERKEKDDPQELDRASEAKGEKRVLGEDSVTAFIRAVRKRQASILSACEEVRGVIGKIRASAYDSASDVYVAACRELGIKCSAASARDAFRAYTASRRRIMAKDNKPLHLDQSAMAKLLNNVRN